MKLTIYGNPKSKKNSMQIVKRGNKSSLIQSEAYRKYEADCLRQISGKYRLHIDYPVNIKAIFYRDSNRRCDITNLLSALHDILVKAGVIADDNFKIVVSVDGSTVKVDKDNPRTEIEITEVI